jgi:hypothetical protein
MHGPPASYTGDLYKEPKLPTLPIIDVLDTVALEFSPRRARKWRELRDEALRMWSLIDSFTFVVKEDRASKYPAYDPTITNEYERLTAPMLPGVVRLMKTPRLLGKRVQAFAIWADPGPWAAFKLGKNFWYFSTPTRRKHLIRHELGHALFGLRDRYALPDPADRTGVMATDLEPDQHDIESLREYYE